MELFEYVTGYVAVSNFELLSRHVGAAAIFRVIGFYKPN